VHTPWQGPGGGGTGFLAVLAMAASQMGPQGDGWAGVDAGRAFGLGPGRKVLFFFEFIFNAKTILEKSRNCLKARKILEKSQKFQENSQRLIGT
jgi:hypothetical protein